MLSKISSEGVLHKKPPPHPHPFFLFAVWPRVRHTTSANSTNGSLSANTFLLFCFTHLINALLIIHSTCCVRNEFVKETCVCKTMCFCISAIAPCSAQQTTSRINVFYSVHNHVCLSVSCFSVCVYVHVSHSPSLHER